MVTKLLLHQHISDAFLFLIFYRQCIQIDDIDLPRPRDPFLLQTTPEFIAIYHRVWDLLRDDIRKSEAA